MAKKQAVTKTQAVRDYLKDHPGAMSKEIAAALTKQGIKINAGHVANIKTKINKEAATKKAAKKPAAAGPQHRQSWRSRREWRHDHAGAGQEGCPHDQDAWRLPASDRSAGSHQGIGRRQEVQGLGGSDDGAPATDAIPF